MRPRTWSAACVAVACAAIVVAMIDREPRRASAIAPSSSATPSLAEASAPLAAEIDDARTASSAPAPAPAPATKAEGTRLVIQGVVRDAHRRPLSSAEVVVLPVRGSKPCGDCPPSMRGSTDAQGRFRIEGNVDGELWFVRATHPRFQPMETDVWHPAPELTFQLECELGAVLGRVLLDPGVSPDAIVVEWRSDEAAREALDASDAPSEPGARGSPRDRWLHEIAVESPSRDGALRIVGLHPGPGELRVRTKHAARPFATFERVRANVGDAERDPRLNPLDLRGRVWPIAIDVLDANGVVRLRGRATVVAHGDGARPRTFDFDDGLLSLVADARGLDVQLQVARHRDLRLTAVREDAVAYLAPGLRVRVSVAGPIPHHLSLIGDLQDVPATSSEATDAADRLRGLGYVDRALPIAADRMAGGTLDYADPRGVRHGYRRFAADRSATFEVARPGRHRLVLHAVETAHPESYPTHLPMPAVWIDVLEIDEEQRIAVEVSAEALASWRAWPDVGEMPRR